MIRLAAVLLAPCSSVLAAPPPLNLVNFAELHSTFPVVNSSVALNNVTRFAYIGSSFPPGPQPPDPPGALLYTVPGSNPKIVVKFGYYELNPGRDESQVYDIFRYAFRDASNPTFRDTAVPEEEHIWWKQGIGLNMTPWRSSPGHVAFLTWGSWHTALTGIDNFRRFYPRLNFNFEVYTYLPGDGHDYCIAEGDLYG